MKTRKDEIDLVAAQCERIAHDPNEVRQAWLRICRELRFLSDPEAKPPKFNALLHAIWIAASGDQT